MARTNNSNTPAQGGGSVEQNLLSGLERSELTEARNEALKDSQSTDPNAANYVAPNSEDEPGILLEAQTPEWVQIVLHSNQALIDSNNLVLVSLDAFKENSAEFVSQLVKEFAKPETTTTSGELKVIVQLIDEDEDYEVAPGKSFRDPVDFTKEYTEGDDVTHLGVIKLQSLLNAGLIVES